MVDFCLSYKSVSVSVCVMNGTERFFCTIEWQNVNIYITQCKYLHFKRVYGHMGSTCHKDKVNASHKMELFVIICNPGFPRD